MELRELQVEVPGNERMDSARRIGVDEPIADNGTGSEDRLIRAISSTIKVLEAAWIATSVIPNHRHGPRVAGNIERSDAIIADNDGKQGGAVFVRSGHEDLAAGPPDVTEHRGRTRASWMRATSQARSATSAQPVSREVTLTDKTTGPGPAQAASPRRTCLQLPACHHQQDK